MAENQIFTNQGNGQNMLFPAEISFFANYHIGIISQGGKLIITPTQLIFRPHSVNLGDLSDKVFNIKDVVDYRKGFLTFFYIRFSNGQEVKLNVWKKQRIIDEIEARKSQL